MDEPAGQDHRPALGRHLVLPGRYLVTLSSSVGSYLDGVWAGPEPEASQLGRCGGVSPGKAGNRSLKIHTCYFTPGAAEEEWVTPN